NGRYGFGGDGGAAVAAELAFPNGVAVDRAGNLFIADTDNQRIRKVTPEGIISTIAGNGRSGFGEDGGPAVFAQIAFPYGVAIDGANTLFIADTFSNRIRKIVFATTSITIANSGGASLTTGNSASIQAGYARI